MFVCGVAAGMAAMAVLRPERMEPGIRAPVPYTPAELALDRRLPEVWFQDVPLDQAAEQLGQLAGVRIELHLESFQKAGFSARIPVTLRLRNATLREVMDELTANLRMHLINRQGLDDYVLSDRIVLSIDEYLNDDTQHVSRTYDLSKLLQSLPHVPANVKSPKGQFVALMQNQVAPASWLDHGGWATSFFFGDQLVVRQTFNRHRELANFLQDLMRPVDVMANPSSTVPIGATRWDETSKQWLGLDPAETQGKLERVLDEFTARDQPLQSAVQALCDRVDIEVRFGEPFVGNYPDPWMNRRVSYSGRQVRVADALDALLARRQAKVAEAGEEMPLDWGLEGAILRVATHDTITSSFETLQVYDVRSLLSAINASPQVDVPSGVPLSTAWSSHLVGLLAKDLHRDVQVRYGFESRVTDLGGRFVIHDTRSNHRRIAAFFARLRKELGVGQAPSVSAPDSRSQ